MLVYVDESGDPGMDFAHGSSQFFVVTAVTFQQESHAQECEARLNKLRKSVGLPEHVELRFSKSRASIRKRILQGVASCDFFYRSVVIKKTELGGQIFPKDKHRFYEYVVGLTLDLWRPYLHGASVDVDRCSGEGLSKHLCRGIANSFKDRNGKSLLKRVRALDSKRSNLLQLADMVCGAVARSFKSETNAHEFRDLINAREAEVVVRP
jgi:Protein of unknown function (DUF3800)